MENITICSECGGIMTEPLCISCFENEVNLWLNDQIISTQKFSLINAELNNLIKLVSLLPRSHMRCIVCSHQMHNICNYCLVKETSEIIKQYISDEDALMIFNYSPQEFGFQRS